MENLINEFLESLKADGKSKCTIQAYGIDLKQFSEIVCKEVQEIKFSDLRMWVNQLSKDGLSATSRARKISCVKSFFKFLYKMEYIEKNPAEMLEIPKIEKKHPKVISESEAYEILFQARNSSVKETVYMRDLAIVATMLYTGVRREELTNIKLSDVDLQNRKILIHGKGNKQRHVFCNDELTAILSEYINGHRKLLKFHEQSQYLFLSSQSDRISVRSVNDVVDKMMERAGCKEKGMSCHQLRKRMATSVFENTGNIVFVQKILGHSNPTVTQRYVSCDEKEIAQAAMSVSF